MNLSTTVFLSIMVISFGIGLILIAYAIVLQRTERNMQTGQLPGGSNQGPAEVPTYVRWIVVPTVVALPAAALTVWAAQMIEPIAPQPCMELYQEALNISKDAPGFKMPWRDRDQLRCEINRAVLNK